MITFSPHYSNQAVILSDDVVILSEITVLVLATNLPCSVRTRYQHFLLAGLKFDVLSTTKILICDDLHPYIMRSRAEILWYPGYPSAFDTALG